MIHEPIETTSQARHERASKARSLHGLSKSRRIMERHNVVGRLLAITYDRSSGC
jgi:hypothetical protein